MYIQLDWKINVCTNGEYRVIRIIIILTQWTTWIITTRTHITAEIDQIRETVTIITNYKTIIIIVNIWLIVIIRKVHKYSIIMIQYNKIKK